jgi:allantoicase
MNQLKMLQKRLDKIEHELSTCRTSALQDGWQTQRHAKKARKWDILAQRKMQILRQIDEIENSQKLNNEN